MRKTSPIALMLLILFLTGPLMAQESAESKSDSDSKAATTNTAEQSSDDAGQAEDAARKDAERAFKELLSGATLVGNFTVDKEGPVDPTKLLKPDRYELATVNKVKGDMWLFVYVHKGVPIPLTMKVLWAGKTPVLTLDEFTIAGMGTFSARLMFHDNLYAGTWRHGETGGLMFGRIETAESKQKKSDVPKKKASSSEQAVPAPGQDK